MLLAFNDRGILARGSNERIEKDWKLNWEEFIKKQMDQHRFKRKTNSEHALFDQVKNLF